MKIFVAIALLTLGLLACSQSPGSTGSETITTPSGLKYEVLTAGNGRAAAVGDTAVVHYTGTLTDGTKFDSSVDRGTPFEFGLGAGNVIQGWDEAVAAMQIGDKWKVTIPPDLAYGDRGVGNLIPPGSTLVFEIELLDLK